MADTRPIAVAIMADDCGVCHAMKRDPNENWDAIADALRATGRVRVEQIHLRAMRNPAGPNWPKDIDRYHKFYPAILLLDGRSWNAAMANKALEISGIVYGGKLNDAKTELVGDKSRPYPRNREALVKWVLDNTGGPLTEQEIRGRINNGSTPSTAIPQQPVPSGVSVGAFETVQDVVRNDQFCTSKPVVHPTRWQYYS